MKLARLQTAALVAACASAAAAAPAGAATSAVGQVKAVYRSVMLAEYFGTASGVCGELTAKGRRDFELDTSSHTCPASWRAVHYELHHKIKGVDNSGYTPAQWRATVKNILAHLTVRARGATATAVGPYGIPGKTKLILVRGRWVFDTAPPSVQS